MKWKKVTLVGVGLLGGSLGLALRRRCLAERVIGYVRRQASIAECMQAGAVDEASCDLLGAVAGADLVVLCTPVAQMGTLMEQLLPALQAEAIITDVGSVKRAVVRQLAPLARKAGAHFIGSHPMAGSEQTGVRAARADLFVDAVCVVTPTRRDQDSAIRKVEATWSAVGSRVVRLTPEKHDLLASRCSHLPHILAAGLTNLVLNPSRPPEQSLLCANGFRDTTRIAAGSVEMWRDIALANADFIAVALDEFSSNLEKWRKAILKGDSTTITKLLATARERRENWMGPARTQSSE